MTDSHSTAAGGPGGSGTATISDTRARIEALKDDFLAEPEALAPAMRALVAQYVALCTHSRERPDDALLRPIAIALGKLIRREDIAEDEDS
jgi:hypothetical protein